MPVTCHYCGKNAKLVEFGHKDYPYEANYGWIHICVPCQAWVGCHRQGKTAMGFLANKELREARQKAHQAFDPLWRRKQKRDGCSAQTARSCGYSWLASEMCLSLDRMHIGKLSLKECEQVVALCDKFKKKVEPAQQDLFNAAMVRVTVWNDDEER